MDGGKKIKTLTDHDEIKKWIEARNGKPVRVKGTDNLLRINLPGYNGKNKLEEISWDEFFKTFDENNLALLCQEQTAEGKESRFFKFINRGA